MFVRKNESNFGKVRNLVAGMFGLEEAARQRLMPELEHLDNDAFRGKLSEKQQAAQELIQAMDAVEEVKDEPSGEGSTWFVHKKIHTDMAESIFELLEPLIELVENTIRGQIASGGSTIASERSLIFVRESMIRALQEVGEALPRDKREKIPYICFYPYDGVKEIRNRTSDMVETLRDFAKQMTAFADSNAAQLIKGSALRSQARWIKEDSDIWYTWRHHSGANYWRLPKRDVIKRTRRHLQAQLQATQKETRSLPVDRSEHQHPETAYSLDETEARLKEFLDLLPNDEEKVVAAVA